VDWFYNGGTNLKPAHIVDLSSPIASQYTMEVFCYSSTNLALLLATIFGSYININLPFLSSLSLFVHVSLPTHISLNITCNPIHIFNLYFLLNSLLPSLN